MGYLSSLLSLANLSPHRGLLFWKRLWRTWGGQVGVTQAMTDGKLPIGSKIWLQPIITSFFFFIVFIFYFFYKDTSHRCCADIWLGAAQWDAHLLMIALLASHKQVSLTVLIRLHDQQSGLSTQLRLQVFFFSSFLYLFIFFNWKSYLVLHIRFCWHNTIGFLFLQLDFALV